MEHRRFKPRLIEVAVILAGVLVTIYAVWVIRSVGASTPDSAPPSPVETLSERPEPSSQPERKPKAPPTLDAFRDALLGSRTILVVGDSTGDDPGEWVDLWAQDLPADREVQVHVWDIGTAQFSDTPTAYGSGPALQIWNLSYPGTQADYAQKLEEVRAKPAVVILNFGHDRSRAALRRAIRTTTEAIDDRWGEVPSAWVLQNPSTDDTKQQQEDAVEFVRSLATTERVPVIDVHAAFIKAGSVEGLVLDGSLPNAQGSRLWADTVNRAVRN